MLGTAVPGWWGGVGVYADVPWVKDGSPSGLKPQAPSLFPSRGAQDHALVRVAEVWEGTENTHLQSHHLKEWQSVPSDGEAGPH